MSAFVLSRLDCCNSILFRCPHYLLNRLQKDKNSSIRVSSLKLSYLQDRQVTLHLRTLHWLPFDARIKYKICFLCFSAITSTGSVCLSDLVKIYTPSGQFDLQSICQVVLQYILCRVASYIAPTVQRTYKRFPQSASFFRSELTTELFQT